MKAMYDVKMRLMKIVLDLSNIHAYNVNYRVRQYRQAENKRSIKMSIQQMTSQRTGNAVPNQYLVTICEYIYFKSYETVIANINRTTNEVTLSEDWDYSCTTVKYLNRFLLTKGKDIKSRIKDGTYKIVEAIELGE